jgi:methionyl-tRNA formyltransferase
LLAGHKVRVWKVGVVEPAHVLPAESAVPGQVLAVTGKGMWVQTGSGQLQIVESQVEEDPSLEVPRLTPATGQSARVILG